MCGFILEFIDEMKKCEVDLKCKKKASRQEKRINLILVRIRTSDFIKSQQFLSKLIFKTI
jgi:hypothetical protein